MRAGEVQASVRDALARALGLLDGKEVSSLMRTDQAWTCTTDGVAIAPASFMPASDALACMRCTCGKGPGGTAAVAGRSAGMAKTCDEREGRSAPGSQPATKKDSRGRILLVQALEQVCWGERSNTSKYSPDGKRK